MDWVLFTTSLKVQIRSKGVRVLLMVQLSNQTSQTKLGCHLGINCLRVGEELSHDKEIRVLAPSFIEKVFRDVYWSRVSIVKSKPIKYASH